MFCCEIRLSLGWNSPGSSPSMSNSDAVIGRWDSFAVAPVLEYGISGKTSASVTPFSYQSISGVSFVSEGGYTILNFTRELTPSLGYVSVRGLLAAGVVCWVLTVDDMVIITGIVWYK